MYIVEITNGNLTTQIHGFKAKLGSGKISKGINTINSFTFSMFPNNPGFALINEFTTHVTVFNTNKQKNVFSGRVLCAETTMDDNGMITKTVTCEDVFGYLCDSVQAYVDTQNWTVRGMLQHLINSHNAQVEEYKHFKLGNVTASDDNDNLYQGVQRENTWDAIKSKLLDKIGGELQYRIESDGIYIDYLEQIGETKETEIALSKNMKSITREQDPTAYITRLIPLGCKVIVDGEETEQRLDISTVNNGINYIEDEEAVAVYGIHVGFELWDDVTTPGILLTKAKAWLKENNKVQVKYTITALDLSLIGLAVDDFDIGNTHPIKNSLIGIDDTARIIKVNIDVCEEVKSSIDVGDNFKTLSDIQREQAAQLKSAAENYKNLERNANNFANSTNAELAQLNQKLANTVSEMEEAFSSEIKQFNDSISLKISGSLGSKASIILSAGTNEQTGELDLTQIRKAFADDKTAVSISAGTITFNAGTLIVNSTYFTVSATGVIKATSGTIGAITLCEAGIYSHNSNYSTSFAGWYRPASIQTSSACFFAGASDQTGANAKYMVTYGGKLTATDATISGIVTTENNSYKAQLSSGGVKLFYDDALCGTINTKYWSGASTEGISLRIEEGGNYIMFSHPSDAGTGYDVDYYLNYGWSDNYDEKHIFQTSARFLDKVYFQSAYFRTLHVYENSYIRCCDSDGNSLEQMLGYSDDCIEVGSRGCTTMLLGTTVYLKNTSTTVTSDRNAKNSIEDLPEAYESFIDALNPVRFKYNEGTSGRYHVGYIAQDVESALLAAGLNTADFAGYVNIDDSGELGLAYDEFIAILHKKIKRLERRIMELESANI